MFKNYLKTAFRNLWKNKTFSSINILGLALGLACSLLIILWVYDEYSKDSFHKNASQLFSVFERQNHDGVMSADHQSPGLMADEMKRVLPEVIYATNYAWNSLCTFEANKKINKMNNWLKDYQYSVQITWWMFAIAALLAILIALLTVSLQAVKSAIANPVKSLRTE
jgi:ABC-type antimicrobial peptide transport system permease subunit